MHCEPPSNKVSLGHSIQNNHILFRVDLSRSSRCCDACLGPHKNPSTKYWVSQSLDKEAKDILFYTVFWFSVGEK